MAVKADIRATRKHKVLIRRERQLGYNLLSKSGGGPYVDARLTRFTCESDASWAGTAATRLKESKFSANWHRSDTSGIIGRKDRAFLINYAGRIVSKINQYVFGQDIERSGIDDAFAQDATKTGLTINALMDEVSASYTAGQWCWIGVDRGAPEIDSTTGQRVGRSVAQREAVGDRIWWSLWHATEVVDWRFDDAGRLLWLITQQDVYDNADYTKEAADQTIRTIWERGGGRRLYLNRDDKGKVDREEPFTISAPIVPFVLVGVPSSKPWWFDDVERVQASLLNLESAHNENLIQAVFPQLVLPHGVINEIMRLTELTGLEGYESALEMVRGLAYPILEPTDASGLTRYLQPSASDLKAIPDEIIRRRKELMNIVGLAMQNQETNQVSSAASKAWDNLDPSNTLRNRAIILEDVEEKAVALSAKLDLSFPIYDVQYPRQFDIPNPEQDIATLVQLGNLDLPDSGRREVMKASMKVLGSMVSIPKERMDQILKDIDAMPISELIRMTDSILPPVSGD